MAAPPTEYPNEVFQEIIQEHVLHLVLESRPEVSMPGDIV